MWRSNYYINGKQHPEKVGTISNAKKLYGKRQEDAGAGHKLSQLRNSQVVSLSDLIDDVPEYVADHKDRRSYISKAEIVRTALGSTPAAELKPQELSRWLKDNTNTPTTRNRYKAFVLLLSSRQHEREGRRESSEEGATPARGERASTTLHL